MGIINYFKEMVDHNLYDYLSDYQKREHFFMKSIKKETRLCQDALEQLHDSRSRHVETAGRPDQIKLQLMN